ncbi:hypothetical protein E0500_031215 [Streptomyces sp. KM273126]|uniref:hypothetical protein n=1 Tax=Streptomyces sp. KM273126 TaxID=2545247 RepID=UPI0010392CE2|nr:hypothetical protein [Streptomyces sp. KM273126]MBA2811676.1 hypothetical protein [Streptomyces sp. KM273126]
MGRVKQVCGQTKAPPGAWPDGVRGVGGRLCVLCRFLREEGLIVTTPGMGSFDRDRSGEQSREKDAYDRSSAMPKEKPIRVRYIGLAVWLTQIGDLNTAIGEPGESGFRLGRPETSRIEITCLRIPVLVVRGSTSVSSSR